ncbi:methylated-DNA--[protein]-cysteine S-methyltransferase [Brevibacillus choshinensis]|uniref:Methylated-DNA--[protein]-cysteine S-methyltransferase n=1 Tax=Brevibacillus choshinensis TaxID=54911 RepID=A0ABX7FSY5_BRECH|nr:methylated-DNA--[protein]-cysteine S-methyltransferase [Brevibacillus choshinensis]QRG69346.1 methylated-DNA--[protein]-cysteine S-methyltransferase [Brevibacillus choshinensis]
MKTEKKPEVYWTLLNHEGWSLYLAATEQGLCFVGSQDQPWEELSEWASQRMPGSSLIQDDARLQPYVTELIAYFDGAKDRFSIPLDVRGTPFQLAVWDALCQIPLGQTRTYSDIAEQIQKPAAVRAVGAAIGANPVLIAVPCHRVIGKNGALTGYRGGMEMKEVLLSHEGVESPAGRRALRA